MAYYDYPTNFSNGTTIDSVSNFFLEYPKYVTDGFSSYLLIIFGFLAFFILGLPFGVGASLLASSFIMTILSTLLWYNGILDFVYVLTFVALVVVSLILIKE